MDEIRTFSQTENEQESEISTKDSSSNLKSKNHTIDVDSQDEAQSSQQNELQRKETTQARHSTIDLLTFTADYGTIKELQKKAQPNVNYFVALKALIDCKELSSESLQLKRQSVTIDNVESGIMYKEKQLPKGLIKISKDLTFQQRMNVYCMAVALEEGNDPFNPFQDKYIRHEFIRKVFTLLFVSLSFTTTLTAIFIFVPSITDYFRENPGIAAILAYSMMGYAVFLMCCIMCFPNITRSHPLNLFVLALYVFLFSMFIAIIAAFHSPLAVITAAGLTVLIVAVIIMFAIQTRWDITGYWFMLFIASFAFMFAGSIFLIIYLITGLKVLYIIYCGIGVALYSAYLMFDIQIIMGGRKYQLSTEDYVPAVIFLFTDIIGIFLHLLQGIDT